jgi:hypothetical protein
MASAKQEMLGRMIDTAMTNDPPFDRRPKFVDSAAASEYMFQLGKKGKKAMDAELHDATYGDAALSPRQRIALARLQTRAWKGDPTARLDLLAITARAGNPHAQKALAALKRAGQTDSMGWLAPALKWASSPLWMPAYGVYKGAQWTSKQLFGTGKGGNAEQQRLAMMKAAAKRRQAAEARAAAADAQTEAEQRAQAAIADAADAEADAADAEALAREEAMKTKEVQADPSTLVRDSDSDEAEGWGFHSLTHGLRKGLGKVASVATTPMKFAAHFIPGRDARKAALVRNTYQKLWYEHANWLAHQDKAAGLVLQPRAAYEQTAKVWAIAQLKANKLPTGLIQDAPTTSAGEAAVRADTLRREIMGGEIMGSWFWPFGQFLSFAHTTINQTAPQRADSPPDEQADQAAPPAYQDLSSLPAPLQDDSSDTSGDTLVKRAKAGDGNAQIALRKREALDGELMGLAPRKFSESRSSDLLSSILG